MSNSTQCSAVTKKGTRCQRTVLPDTRYCYQHQQTASELKHQDETNKESPLINDHMKATDFQKNINQNGNSDQPQYLMWDLIKLGTVALASYFTYRLLKRILK